MMLVKESIYTSKFSPENFQKTDVEVKAKIYVKNLQ